jgi:hypothetical protein
MNPRQRIAERMGSTMDPKNRRMVSLIGLWAALAAMAFGQAGQGPANGAPARLRVGGFSIIMPGPARVVSHQNRNGAEATIYSVTVAQVTFIMNYLRFSSPQEAVIPAEFARNMTSSDAQAKIVGFGRDQVGGYSADKVLYRIGQTTYMAWSVQPRPELNYIFSASGPDSPQFRSRAKQFALSFRGDALSDRRAKDGTKLSY